MRKTVALDQSSIHLGLRTGRPVHLGVEMWVSSTLHPIQNQINGKHK